YVRVLAEAVREIARAGREHRRPFADLRLVAHAEAAAGHLHPRTGGPEHAVVAFLAQLVRVHLGRRRDPQLDRDVTLALEQLAGGAEVADVGHAAADE